MNDNQVEFWKEKAKNYEFLFIEQKRIAQEYKKLTDEYHEILDAERSKREDTDKKEPGFTYDDPKVSDVYL